MAKLGVADLRQLALPSGWDGDYITQQKLKDGLTYDQVFTRLAAAVAAFNADLTNHPWLFVVCYQADNEDFMLEYSQGARKRFEQHAEYALPDVVRAETSGHLIDIKPWDLALGWTWDYLRKARTSRIDHDIRELTDAAEDVVEIRVLRRLFRLEDDLVGAAGYSPGFANNAAAHAGSNISFTPPEHDSVAFLSTHDHYLRYAGRGQAALMMARHLWEHGHDPPYEMWVYSLDAADWSNVKDDTCQVYFRSVQDPQFEYATDLTLLSAAYARMQYFGALDVKEVGPVFLRKLNRVPDEYCAMFKPYGLNDPRNPLWWRGGDPPVDHQLISFNTERFGASPFVPIGFMEFGFGVGMDRTSAVLCQIAGSGTYTTPTIS